jgi:lipopolysaccharide/colanic/teichoic acid biosynthesis glycosyltransferase
VTSRKTKRYAPAKRLLDVAAAIVGLVIASPIILVVAILVAGRLGRPVIFSQQRPGRDGRLFRLYKFRTMRPLDSDRELVTDGQRLTSFGRVLRATSLDELPTLVNVLGGSMSIVGPRPLLTQYLDRYSPAQARRHEVRPGITGLAQVSGRNSISWEQKFELDVHYVDTYSFRLDASILSRTVLSVLRRDGISAEGHATAQEFLGQADGVAE